jgi:REP element-mobilizing transposase RayT
LLKTQAMSLPRCILPGATYLITRRVLRRHFLLRPDAVITDLIIYALGVSAPRFGIQVHALCAMSSHLHLVVTDPRGVLPSFLGFFHRIVALCTKVVRAWEGPVWDHEPTSVVRLMTRAAIVEKIAYTLANPVAAGLVLHANEWPGAKVLVDEIGGGVLRATRPSVYLDPKNPAWPAEVALEVSLPPGIEVDEAEEFRREVAEALTREEAKANAALSSGEVLGAAQASSVSPIERATSVEPLRSLNPTFAVGRGDGSKEAWLRAAAAVRAFRAAYRAALAQWRECVREVVFPEGTWWMRVCHAAGIQSDVSTA